MKTKFAVTTIVVMFAAMLWSNDLLAQRCGPRQGGYYRAPKVVIAVRPPVIVSRPPLAGRYYGPRYYHRRHHPRGYRYNRGAYRGQSYHQNYGPGYQKGYGQQQGNYGPQRGNANRRYQNSRY